MQEAFNTPPKAAYRIDAENVDVPREAKWGSKTMNAIKNTFAGIQVNVALKRIERKRTTTAADANYYADTVASLSKHIAETRIEAEAREVEMEALRRASEAGGPDARDAQKKYARAKAKYERESKARNERLEDMLKQRDEQEKKYRGAYTETAKYDRSRLEKTQKYISSLETQLQPLDSHYDALTKRRAELVATISDCTRLRDEHTTRIAEAESLYRNPNIPLEQKNALRTHLDNSYRVSALAERALADAESRLATLDVKHERLREPRARVHELARAMNATFTRIKPWFDTTSPEVPHSNALDSQNLANREQSNTPTQRPDEILLRELLEGVRFKSILFHEYIDHWNVAFPESKIEVPQAEWNRVITVAEAESFIIENTDTNHPDDDIDLEIETLRERFKTMRIAMLTL